MSSPHQWLLDFQETGNTTIEGIVSVDNYSLNDLPPDSIPIMEKAEEYGAKAVFFEKEREGRPPIAQAFIFVCDEQADKERFAKLHQRMWSWGGVPLVYRVTPGKVELFRCAHKADFEKNGEISYKAYKTLKTAAKIANDPWWDSDRLYYGSIWDDPTACKKLLSGSRAAQNTLIKEVKALNTKLEEKSHLDRPLQRKLLILSLMIAYLEERKVLTEDYFYKFKSGANEFFEILKDGEALVNLLENLEERFNGQIFTLSPEMKTELRENPDLSEFVRLIEGIEDTSGQLNLWKRYSFADLPVELISHVYQLFVEDKDTAVYTPPFLVKLMLGEVLTKERLDRLIKEEEIILDPACGSGVFLVEAYKRLVLHWRAEKNWEEKPGEDDLKELLTKYIYGIDKDKGATELTAFSLCLALCDALKPDEISDSRKIFPPLLGKNVYAMCFFEAREQNKIEKDVGIIVGNPPFKSELMTDGAKSAYERYNKEYADERGKLPDKQIAYLFLHKSMEMLTPGGVLSMLQQYSFLYNEQSISFRKKFFEKWDVREILDMVSITGLFKKSKKNTKVVVIVAEAKEPSPERKILHATFRRSGRTHAEQGFNIDYYDLHWLKQETAVESPWIWRSDLFGGGRVFNLIERLKEYRTLEQYANEQDWDHGEGFIKGGKVKRKPAKHITGSLLIRPYQLEEEEINIETLQKVEETNFRSAYSKKRFTAPMVLVRENENLAVKYFSSGYYTYEDKIVGFCVGDGKDDNLSLLFNWFKSNRETLIALVCAGGTTNFTQRDSQLSLSDIRSLPSPDIDLDLSFTEKIVVSDIVEYYRELIRKGQNSDAMTKPGIDALPDFNGIYTGQINAIYKEKKLKALEPQTWAGFLCQPYVFGDGEVDWSGSDGLKDKLEKLMKEKRPYGLNIYRIARIYDGPFIFLLKPNVLRYWLRSIALRDADETLSDLWKQGF